MLRVPKSGETNRLSRQQVLKSWLEVAILAHLRRGSREPEATQTITSLQSPLPVLSFRVLWTAATLTFTSRITDQHKLYNLDLIMEMFSKEHPLARIKSIRLIVTGSMLLSEMPILFRSFQAVFVQYMQLSIIKDN